MPRTVADVVRALPTPEEMYAARKGKSIPKGQTRLERTIAQRPLTKVDDQHFKADVWTRDHGKCRCCGRKVTKTLARVPERGEVHHLHGRTGDLRFEVRAAVLLCLQDHERVTGKVNAHRMICVPSRTFVTRQGTFSDATYPVLFSREGGV